MNLTVGQNMQLNLMNEFEIESEYPWSNPQHYSDQNSINQEWSSNHVEQSQIYQTPDQYYKFGHNSNEYHWSTPENNSYYGNHPNNSNMNGDHITGDWNLQPREWQNAASKMNIDNEFSFNETFILTEMEENSVFLPDEYDLLIGETSDLGSSINSTMEEVNGEVNFEEDTSSSFGINTNTAIGDYDDGIKYESDIPANQMNVRLKNCNEIENVSNITNGSNVTDNTLVECNQVSNGLSLINLQKFDLQCDEKQNVSDSKSTKSSISSSRLYSEWQTDETLPTGWKKRSFDKRNCLRNLKQKGYQYISSDNQIFKSRKDIVAHMEKFKTYSTTVIKRVLSGRKNIRLYEWEVDNKLPSGWKSAYSNEKNYNFLSPDNKQFHSRKAAVNFMKKTQYSNEDIEKVLQYTRPNFQIKAIKCRVPHKYLTDWISDSTLPDGWKKRAHEKIKQKRKSRIIAHDYISSDNQMFKSRADIVAHMENSSSYTESDIKKVLSGKKNFSRYEWEIDNNLPKGWKTIYANRQYKFLTPENKRFKSKATAVEFMKKSQYYSTDDISKVEYYSRQNKKCKNIKNVNVHLNVRQYITGWISDSTLPDGWKKRSFQVNDSKSVSGKITRYEYLTDDNEIFSSRSRIVSVMKNSDKYDDKDIENVLSGLRRRKINEDEHFISDTGLPTGWKIMWSKHSRHGTKRKYMYISPDNKRFLSRRAAVEEIRTTGVHSEKELHAMLAVWLVKNGIVKPKLNTNRGKSKTERNSEHFVSDTGLPSGWKIKWLNHDKNGTKRKYIYISPMNKTFRSRKAAVEEIRTTGVHSEKELHAMLAVWLDKNGIVKPKLNRNRGKYKTKNSENFVSDTGLPAGWKIKWVNNDKNGTTRKYMYISPMNKNFPSRKAAVEEIRSTGMHSESELQTMLSDFRFNKSDFIKPKLKTIEGNSRVYSDWKLDHSLPVGWKKRSFKENACMFLEYLSPEQKKFASKTQVIRYMENSNLYSKEVVQKVEMGRRRIGPKQNFITDTGLPPGWKVKWFKNSKNGIKRFIYISPLNQIFNSRKAAIEEIKTEELKNKIKINQI